MDLLQTLIQLRDDLKTWVTNNLVALEAKIDSNTVPIDSELNINSTNLVQNKAVAKEIFELDSEVAALNTKVEDLEDALTDLPEDQPNINDDESGEFNLADPQGNVVFKVDAAGAHTTKLELSSGDVDAQLDSIRADIAEVAGNAFSGDYNDLTNRPNIQDDESGEYVIADNDGNVIFKVDAAGAHTTEINLSGTNVKETLESLAGDIDNINIVKIPDLNAELAAHKADKENPHEVGFKQLKDNNITDDESGEVVYADPDGNIIAKIDVDGLRTTKVTAESVTARALYTTTVTANAVNVSGKNVVTLMDEKDSAVRADLAAHTGDTGIHITSAERIAWNAKADTDYVDEAVANLVDSSPATLDTLNELAAALGDDPNFAATVAQQIGEKASQADLVAHTEATDAHENMGWLSSVDEVAVDPVPFDADTLNGHNSAYFESKIAEAITSAGKIPACDASNNGQFLCVVNGVATWVTIPGIEEASF